MAYRSLYFLIALIVSINARSASICQVTLDDFCNAIPTQVAMPSRDARVTISNAVAANCPVDPTITLNGTAYSFEYFNLISFNNFHAVSADVEGRAAIRRNLDIPMGQYSFGYEIGADPSDVHLPYSLVVGGDAKYTSGAVYPLGNLVPYSAAQEFIFVGGKFDAPSYLQDVRKGSCPVDGCLNADFDVAKTYYDSLSAAWAAQANNVVETVIDGKLTLTCIDPTANSYVTTLTGSTLSSVTDYDLVSCNPSAQIVFNIIGSGNVAFAGNHLKFPAEKVLYNIVGSGRTVTVTTQVTGSVLAPSNVYIQPGTGVVVGQVIAGDVLQAHQINRLHCDSQVVPPSPHPTPSTGSHTCAAFISDCDGLIMNVAGYLINLADYDIVSFGDFNANTGDIEGRLAARNDASLGYGWSSGYMIHSNPDDRSEKYSFIAGHDVTWGSGWAYPDGTGIPFGGNKEDLFVGGDFDAPQYLKDRRSGACNGGGCLDAAFDYAQECYNDFSQNLASEVDNVNVDVYWSGLFLTCNNPSSSHYTFTLQPAQMNAYTYISPVSNCNPDATWTVNVAGPGPVTFTGGSFPTKDCNKITYNILGSNRNVFIHDTTLCGNLLAQDDIVDQSSGLIVGRVAAGTVHMSLQINRPNCTNNQMTTGNVPVVLTTGLKPVTSQPLTTKAMTSQAITSAQMTSQGLTSQAVTSAPLTTREVTSSPMTTVPVSSQFMTTQPVTSSPLTTQAVTSSPLTTQAVTSAPLTTTPVSSQFVTTQPVTSSPLTTQPVTSSPLTTQPVTSSPLTTQPVTSAPLTTVPVSSQFLTTQEITSSPLTTRFLTTRPVTSSPLTTQSVTSSPLTTQSVTSAPLTTQDITSQPLTTQAVTSSPLTTQPVTSSPLTTQAVTSSPLTTQPVTSSPLTTRDVTSSPLTTQPVTSAPLTTQPVTSAPLTTQPLTSAPLTTQGLTSADLTTSPLTTAPLTTAVLTTLPLTSSPLTTRRRPARDI